MYTPYKGGETAIDHQDLNNFDARLKRLENLTVGAPLELNNKSGGMNISLSKYITQWIEVELVEDLPPYGAAKASVIIHVPEDDEEVDWANLVSDTNPAPTDPLQSNDEQGFARGRRTTHFIIVHDNQGIASWRGDRGLARQSRVANDGRFLFLNPSPGDQIVATLLYTDTLSAKDFIYPITGSQLLYAKYMEKINTNQRLFSVEDDETVGNVYGNGVYIRIARNGWYEVQASLYAIRIGSVTGADFETRYSNGSYLRVELEQYCSTSWNTLDYGEIRIPPFNGFGGTVFLHGKFQACSDATGVRVTISPGGNTGDLRLTSGNLQIKRVFHNHPALWADYVLGNDGVPNANVVDYEGGYTEEDEKIQDGEYDEDWIPDDGPDPKKFNSGYPRTVSNPQWPQFPL